MDECDKKYYFELLKRYSLVVGSSLLLAYGVHKYKENKENKKNIGGLVNSSEVITDSLKNSNNYSIKFKN